VGLLSQHRILLPADQYLFKGKSLHQEQAILVLVVEGVQLPPSRPVTAQQLKTLLADAKGLSKVASPVAPLVYFTQNGLLVFSQNAEPLGSRRNPGRVIARLLARDGQPVVLRQQPGQPFALAKFVRFTPPSTAVRTEPNIAPTP
jgi:hypothetical protein